MKLEVGMYCYNKIDRQKGIGKIINFQSNNNVNIKYKNDIELVSAGNVIASFNIIDILKVGYYVNGEKIIRIFKPTFLSLGELPYVITRNSNYEENEIKSIVTKEQFEQISYKLGE